MNTILILVATAALFAGFGLAARARRDCPGADACDADELAVGCGGCPHAHPEVSDADA
jgi:hypothetical protein